MGVLTGKVMLCRAVAAEPRVLLLDRPFDGLDARSRGTLRWVVDSIAGGMRPLLVGTAKASECGSVLTGLYFY